MAVALAKRKVTIQSFYEWQGSLFRPCYCGDTAFGDLCSQSYAHFRVVLGRYCHVVGGLREMRRQSQA
jgi:hypothetical protein